MKIDLNRIDQTLELIAHGQLAPEAAARRLLGLAAERPVTPLTRPQNATLDRPLDRSLSPPRQTLAQLVRSLGTPPPEIEHDWRRQIQALARDWQQTHGTPLPPPELGEIWIDADNRLSLGRATHAVERPSAPSDSRRAADPATPNAHLHAPTNASPDPQEPAVVPLLGRRTMTLAALALATCTVIALYGGRFFRAEPERRSAPPRSAERSEPATRSAATRSELTPSAPRSRPPLAASPNPVPEPLQTLLPLDAADADLVADSMPTEPPLLSAALPSFAADGAESTADTDVPPETPQHRAAQATTTDTDSLPPQLTPEHSSQPQPVADWLVRFQFAEPQASVVWPLATAADFTADAFALEVDVPQSVQLTWIEPLAAHNLRRSGGLLQWAPAGAETPLIGCRLELRVAAHVSLKLRYAAQLDPSLPWQTFTPEQLEQAVERAATTLQRLLAQQSELARQYAAASSSNRRLLKPTKDAVDQNVQRLQMLTQRLQQLNDLQATVAQAAQLRIMLTTQQPDRQPDRPIEP